MLQCLIIFLVGAHLGAKYPKQATFIVDKAVDLGKAAVNKIKGISTK
jgi:hypothetical protein